MDGKELREALEKLDVSMDEFARSIGVKESTMRVCVYGNRVTKKMEAEINRMLGERARVGELEEIGEMIEDVVAPVREVEKRVREAEELIGREIVTGKQAFD